jgi:membrane protease YdiL (CAAX protease family)
MKKECTMKTLIKTHPVLFFFMMTFAFTWLLWGSIYALHLSSAVGYLPFLVGAAGPSIMAFAVSAIIGGKQEVRDLWKRITFRHVGLAWYLIALFFPAIIALAALGLYRLTGEAFPVFTFLVKEWYLIPIALIIGFILGGPLEEEFGWRGFAITHLQKRHNALYASLLVGILWGVWHLPAFLIPWSSQHNLPVVLFLLHDIALSVLFTWIFNNTGGSVLLTMLAHTAFNATITILPILPSAAGNEHPLAIAVALLYTAAIIITLIFGAKMFKREERNGK